MPSIEDILRIMEMQYKSLLGQGKWCAIKGAQKPKQSAFFLNTECYHYGKKGHIARNCPKKRTPPNPGADAGANPKKQTTQSKA